VHQQSLYARAIALDGPESEAISALFVERFDEGEGSFLQKFHRPIRRGDDDIYQLAAEPLYVLQFFTSLTGPEKKIETLRLRSVGERSIRRPIRSATELLAN